MSYLWAWCGVVQACFIHCSPQCKELSAQIPPALLGPSDHAAVAVADKASAAAARSAAAAAAAADRAAAEEAEAIADAADAAADAAAGDGRPGKRQRRPSAVVQVQSTPRIYPSHFYFLMYLCNIQSAVSGTVGVAQNLPHSCALQ